MHRAWLLRSPRPRTGVALGLGALCLFLASGRMNTLSTDGSSQLAQAVHFCVTGHIAAAHPIYAEFSPRDFTSTTAFYDSNDIGGTLLMLPAACAAALHGAPDPASLFQLTDVAKAGASMTFSLVGALGVIFVLLALDALIGLRRATWWSLAFLFSTGFLAYIKGTWDVLPAATAVAMLVWVVVRSRMGLEGPRRALVLAAIAVGVASLCRYTLAPFLLLGAIAAMWPAIRAASIRQRAASAAVLAVLLMPDFAWNQIRTGEFWRPGEANPSPAFGHPDLTIHYMLTTVGLFFGLHEGLLFYAPICLLGYVAALIYVARSRGTTRAAWAVGLATAVGYAVTVCLLHVWEVFGWGPRYLVPLYPIAFVVAVLTAERWIIPKTVAYACVVLGALTSLPLIFANWHAIVAIVGIDSRAPDAIVGLSHSMIDGLATGHGFGAITTLVGPGYGGDAHSLALQVPDTWWWHVVARHVPHLLGPVALVGIGAAIVAAIVAAAHTDTRPSPAVVTDSTPSRVSTGPRG